MNRWQFRRAVVRAATRKLQPRAGLGMRRPEPGETPLSSEEIFHGALHGFIRLPSFAIPQPQQKSI